MFVSTASRFSSLVQVEPSIGWWCERDAGLNEDRKNRCLRLDAPHQRIRSQVFAGGFDVAQRCSGGERSCFSLRLEGTKAG